MKILQTARLRCGEVKITSILTGRMTIPNIFGMSKEENEFEVHFQIPGKDGPVKLKSWCSSLSEECQLIAANLAALMALNDPGDYDDFRYYYVVDDDDEKSHETYQAFLEAYQSCDWRQHFELNEYDWPEVREDDTFQPD